MEPITRVVPSHHVFLGPVSRAWSLAKNTGCPIQHMMSDGRLVTRWFVDGRRRQETRSAKFVQVIHTGRPFFLDS